MAVSMREVRAALEPEEPDYARAAELGKDALPHLATLVDSHDVVYGPRAVYLAVRIGGEPANDIIRRAAGSHDPLFRVAAAAVARDLPAPTRNLLLLSLLRDSDRGVKRLALNSVGKDATPDIVQRLSEIGEKDNDPAIRRHAGEVRKRIQQ